MVRRSLVRFCARAPKMYRVLTTSRERLNLQEETVFRIEGMDFPQKRQLVGFEY